MKTKKKNTNTYKFQSFAQRITNINIDVFTLTGDKFHGIPEDEKDTFFRETLEKLGEMNCSLDFIAMYKELKPHVRTFNLLVYHKAKITSLLKQYLSIEGSFATKACLELLANFSRDLSQDFYPIFEELFGVLIQLLKSKDAEVIEDTFVCLAYIFKCTWRYMVHEIDNIFRNFKCVLSDNQAHVQSFAAELFAFLIQKSKKRKLVIQFLLEEVSKEGNLAVGVGCLLFQTIKGIKKQFILSAKELLHVCLGMFMVPSINKEQVFTALQTTWELSLKHTQPEHGGLLFESIYESIEEVLTKSTDSISTLSSYFLLLNVGVSHKHGYYIEDQNRLFEVMEKLFTYTKYTPEDISSLLILFKSCIEISKMNISDAILVKVFTNFLDFQHILAPQKLDFCRSLFYWNKFDEDLKSHILEYVCKCLLTDKEEDGFAELKYSVLQFIVDLIYKDIKPDEPFYIHIHEMSLLQLPVSDSDRVLIENLLLEEMSVALWESDVEQLWTSVTCLCYCKLTNEGEVVKKLSAVIEHGLQLSLHILKEDSLCTLAYCIKALLILEKRSNCIIDVIPWEKMMILVKNFSTNEHVLQAFESYCSCLVEEIKQFSKECVGDLYDLLKVNINSPNKLLCLLTLKIFKHFDEYNSDEDTEQDVLQCCIGALNTSVLLSTYQERLIIMRMVTWNDNMKQLHQDAALRFLISNLYINFNLMWEPVYELIASYANSGNKLFWEIWVKVLNTAADTCVSYEPHSGPAVSSDSSFSKCFTVISAMKDEVRIDHRNFRILLWNSMCKFSDVVERNAKDIVPLYLRFMKEEYSLIDEMVAKKQDISIKDTPLAKEGRKSSGKGKCEFQALCAHLRVFSMFKKPRKLEKEFHLYQLYLDFLTSKDNEIQCLAIKCLMTYSHPYMTPYKENFDKLMDDTKFRDELMFFSAAPGDEENEGIINQEHLKLLMPILIRLLYGKLQRRSGLGASGKTGSYARRNIIMQFLINSSNEEIDTFFDLILEPFKILKDLSFTSSSIDITAIVPLRKQSGFLNMFSTVLTRLAKKAETFLPQMFDTLLRILWTCSEIMRLKDQVHVSYTTRVKDIRRLGLVQLNDLFERQEDHFKFHDHLDDMFNTAVWPQLPDITTESCQCPTPLLKVFLTWSKHREYHFLLSRMDGAGMSPISSLFQLLQSKSLSGTVENVVMNITWNILNKEDGDNSDTGSESDCLNLIKPYISIILNHISTNISSKTKDAKKKQMMKNVIPNIQFSVLSKLSKLVSDTEQSSVIVGILFPLLQCIGSEATQLHIITAINNLLPYIDCTVQYLSIVPSLFSMVQARNPRQVLCEVYVKMTRNSDKLEIVGDIVYSLNSWEVKRLDEPDYDKRLDAYRNVSEKLKSSEWNSDEILPILHNALYFLLTTEDLSLRNAASSCIETIICAVETKKELFTDIILKALFPFVKNGIKSKKEEVRVEFISLLGLLIKTFVDHEQFMDMACLCSDNPETDFFKNFNHIQIHRKIRAIHQLASLCDEGKLSVKNMFFIMIPMITPFIFTKLAASKDHNLLSETISAVGCIMKQMPWSKYSHVLKNYLKILQKDIKNQKNVLRLLMAVLNNFHFDLSPLDVKNDSHADNLSFEKKSEETKMEEECEKSKEKEETKIEEGHAEEKEEEKEEEHPMDEEKEAEAKDIKETLVSEETELDEEDEETRMEEDLEEKEEETENSNSNPSSYKTLKRIHTSLTDYIIPQLNKFLQKKNPYDSSKSNYKEVDDQDMLKLPMELALSQLLHKLPGGILHVNLPGVLLRVSKSLRSHSKDVREMARDTLKKISYSLGASYLSLTLKEMKSILQHGYQRHVLGFTLHSVLENMMETLKSGDLDSCVQDVMEIVVDELVGAVAEEKEVAAIANKLFEAQHRKSNATSEITAKFVSSEYIGKVIGPLKEVLDSSQSHTVIHKIEEVLYHVANGLQSNKGLVDKDIMVFIYGVLSDAMNTLANKEQEEMSSVGEDGQRQDCFLVAEKPTRGGVTPRTSDKTNNHILITFGLHLLNSCLKRQRFVESDSDHVNMLDPIVPLVMKNIVSPHNKIVTLSLKCLCALFKFQLPSTKSYYSMIGKNLFKIMKTFTQAGATKGKDVELVATSFKTMTILIRDYKDFVVTDKQFKILLSLVEEDIHTSSRQVVALPLLRAILSRKVKINLVSEIITKISDLSIRDSDTAVQLHCRKIVLQYILDYPLGKKIINHFDFYISHLSYEEETGRISALEMLTLIFNNIPRRLLSEYAGYVFIPLVMMLVNDDSPTCRRLCGCTIKVLIQMLNVKARDEMFDIVKKFHTNSNVSLQHASVQLVGLYAEVEKKDFSRHVDSILPLFEDMLQSYAKTKDHEDDRAKDKSLYNTINCSVKIFNETGLLSNKRSYFNHLGRICGICKDHLLHPHAWIRLAVSQLFSLYFGSFTPEEWLKRKNTADDGILEISHNLKDLSFSFLAQLKDNNLSKEIGEQATKNLVFLFRVVKLLDPLTNNEERSQDSEINGESSNNTMAVAEEKDKPLSVKIFIRKLGQLSAYEAANNPKETKKRICVLRLLASLSLCLGEDHLKDYLIDVLPSIHRELGPSATDGSPLYTLAQEVLELIQNVVKKDVFADAYSKMQRSHMDKKESKKRKLLTEAITNPSQVALRKQKKNLAKRDQRKRKLDDKKPLRKFKKIRASNDNSNG